LSSFCKTAKHVIQLVKAEPEDTRTVVCTVAEVYSELLRVELAVLVDIEGTFAHLLSFPTHREAVERPVGWSQPPQCRPEGFDIISSFVVIFGSSWAMNAGTCHGECRALPP
jgi:hypothetical protein